MVWRDVMELNHFSFSIWLFVPNWNIWDLFVCLLMGEGVKKIGGLTDRYGISQMTSQPLGTLWDDKQTLIHWSKHATLIITGLPCFLYMISTRIMPRCHATWTIFYLRDVTLLVRIHFFDKKMGTKVSLSLMPICTFDIIFSIFPNFCRTCYSWKGTLRERKKNNERSL